MPISPGLMQLCFELDRFQIATAIGHISKDVFIHWNRSFEEDEGRPEAEDLERVTQLIDRAINDLVNAFTSGPPITEQQRRF